MTHAPWRGLLAGLVLVLNTTIAYSAENKPSPTYSEELLQQAESGDPQAQANLGLVYQAGVGIQPDYTQAKKWLLRAAEKDNQDAQMGLWLLYKKGQGVVANEAEAFKWLLATARHGNPIFQGIVGLSYARGQGVMQNDKEAEKWLRMAAERKDPVAQYYLADFYIKNKRSSKYSESLELLNASSAAGYPPAYTDLAIMYAQGLGVTQDKAKALQLMQQAADMGDAEAQMLLSRVRIK